MILLLIVVSVAVREILGRELPNLVKMAKMMVYNVELAKLCYAYPQLKIAGRFGYPLPSILACLVTRLQIVVPGTKNNPLL
jgi:hypothetical protein